MLSWKIGDASIDCVVEGAFPFPAPFLLPKATAEEVAGISWLKPHFLDESGNVTLSIQALCIKTPSKRIVVDTCMGNDKTRAGGAGHQLKTDFLDRLAAAGFTRENVDVVLCTHLHIDHVGWNTMLVDGKWVPTFPNARYLISRAEFEYWRERTEGDDGAIFADSVRPVFDAGLVDLVDPDHTICPEVSLKPTPGHTPGHVSVQISSKGQTAFITGDLAHHPSQFARPEWCSFVDVDPQGSEATRRRVLGELVGRDVLVIGTHFTAPTAGRIVRDGETYRFQV